MANPRRSNGRASIRGERKRNVDLAVRLHQRHAVGPLRPKLVKPKTLSLYAAACQWFFHLLRVQQIPLPSLGEFDDLVSEVIEYAWDAGLGRNLVGNLLSGLEHRVSTLNSQLRGSWRLWRVWGETETPSRASPPSSRAVLAVAHNMWSRDF